jgi:FixJ family two-component response regulator
MGEAESIVFIIDDDPLYLASSERLVRSIGFSVQSFESARDFLGQSTAKWSACARRRSWAPQEMYLSSRSVNRH